MKCSKLHIFSKTTGTIFILFGLLLLIASISQLLQPVSIGGPMIDYPFFGLFILYPAGFLMFILAYTLSNVQLKDIWLALFASSLTILGIILSYYFTAPPEAVDTGYFAASEELYILSIFTCCMLLFLSFCGVFRELKRKALGYAVREALTTSPTSGIFKFVLFFFSMLLLADILSAIFP